MQIAFVQEGDGTFTGLCACGFSTKGWPTGDTARARVTEHRAEHETGDILRPLSEFRDEHDLVVHRNDVVFPEAAQIIEEGD